MSEEKTRQAAAGHDVHYVALPSGFRLGRYELQAVLGHGGFGITYRALDTELNRAVAIKEYLPSDVAVRVDGATVRAKSGRDEEGFAWGLERFLEEARALALFENAHIVRVHDYMQANGTAYMVMALIDGEPLSALLRREGPLPEDRLKTIVLPVLDGLDDVHRAGFLHRDIKPANILIRPNGSPVLIDFGAARQALGEKSRSITSVFTPGYAPFEQYTSSGKQGPWTDIYALAATLYHGIAGKPPPQATDRIREDDMEPAASVGAGRYSRPFLDAIDAGLAVTENRRPQDIVQWRAMLNGESPSGPAAAPPLRPSRGKRLVLAAGVGALLLAGGGGYAAWQSIEEERKAAAQRLEAEAEAREKAAAEARARAEQEQREAAEAQRRMEQEAKARAEADARRKAEEAAAARAAEAARAREEAEAKRRADEEEARLRAELEARIRAELEAQQKRDAEIRRQAEEETRRKLEAEARAKADADRRTAEAERKARAAAAPPAPAARPAAASVPPSQQAAVAPTPPVDPKRYVAENWDAMRGSVEKAMNAALVNHNRRVQTIDRYEAVSVTAVTVTIRISATVTQIAGMSRLDNRTMTVELRNQPPGFPAIGAR